MESLFGLPHPLPPNNPLKTHSTAFSTFQKPPYFGYFSNFDQKTGKTPYFALLKEINGFSQGWEKYGKIINAIIGWVGNRQKNVFLSAELSGHRNGLHIY